MTHTLTPEGCTFHELFEVDGLQRLDARFLEQLQKHNLALHTGLLGYRDHPSALTPLAPSTASRLVARLRLALPQ